MARPPEKDSIIEELSMEITARAMNLEEGPLHPVMVRTHLKAIQTASLTICSLTSGVRTAKCQRNARLVEVMG